MNTKIIPVMSELDNIKAIRFEGLCFFIELEDGSVKQYRYEFVE